MTIAVIVFATLAASVVSAQPKDAPPKTKDCFKIGSASLTVVVDEAGRWNRYDLTAENTCPFTIDAVYIGMTFTDSSGYRCDLQMWARRLASTTRGFAQLLKRYIEQSRPQADGTLDAILPQFMNLRDMRKAQVNLQYLIRVAEKFLEVRALVEEHLKVEADRAEKATEAELFR